MNDDHPTVESLPASAALWASEDHSPLYAGLQDQERRAELSLSAKWRRLVGPHADRLWRTFASGLCAETPAGLVVPREALVLYGSLPFLSAAHAPSCSLELLGVGLRTLFEDIPYLESEIAHRTVEVLIRDRLRVEPASTPLRSLKAIHLILTGAKHRGRVRARSLAGELKGALRHFGVRTAEPVADAELAAVEIRGALVSFWRSLGDEPR